MLNPNQLIEVRFTLMSSNRKRTRPSNEKKDLPDKFNEISNNTEKKVPEHTDKKLNNVLNFQFENKSNYIPFIISSCNVNNLLLEGVIYSPNYDLLIYLIDTDLLKEKEELFFNIKIEISVEDQKKTERYNLASRFSKEKYFSRFSGLFDDFYQKNFIVNVSLDLKNPKILRNENNNTHSYSSKFNFIELDTIKGKKVYDRKDIVDKKNISAKLKQFNNYNFYISFNGTEEIIGPFKDENILKESLIMQHYTHIIPIPIDIRLETKTDKLFFFVEIINSNEFEFFGVFPSSVIKRDIASSYNLSINGLKLNPKTDYSNIDNYPSGTIICGTLKRI